MKGFTVSDVVYTDGSSIRGERSAGDSEAMIDQKSGEGHRVPSCEYSSVICTTLYGAHI